MRLRDIFSNLFVYGSMHLAVDAVCSAVIFSIFREKIVGATEFFSLIIAYNVLAFGLQFIFGYITDYFKFPRIIALAGCVLTGLSALVFLNSSVLAIILAGVGNALFHVGGGTISLNLTPKKATAPGIFVAPGAFGILLGTIIGKAGNFVVWPFILSLFILCVLMFVIKKPGINYIRDKKPENKVNFFAVILIFVFLSIAIRSLVGFAVSFPWKSSFDLLVLLTTAIVLGKALGGVLADRLGWIKTAVGALVLSIPFLAFGSSIAYLGIIGMFLFNITMPVTLVALSNLMPGRPGFAFGLTCLALLLGTFPIFMGLKPLFDNSIIISFIILVSATALYGGLQLLINNKLFNYNKANK